MGLMKSKYAGDWLDTKKLSAKDNGTWKSAKRAYIKDNGEWKLIYAGGDNNILSYTEWNIGDNQKTQVSGNITYRLNGDGNKIISDIDPFGKTTAVWQTTNNDITSDADGGWVAENFPIDNTKTYRYSVWVKRKTLGNGSFYLGVYGYNDAGANNGVYRLTDGVLNGNHYFDSGNWDTSLDTWYLLVAHMHPNDYSGGQHIDSGWYVAENSSKVANLSFGDAKWHPSTTFGKHRTYLYYSTNSSTDQRWVYPRVDLVDGTEPTISQLVSGTEGMLMKRCKDWFDFGYTTDGIYTINPTGNNEFDVYCDMTTDGGGWTVVAEQDLYQHGYPTVTGDIPNPNPNTVTTTRIENWPMFTEFGVRNVVALNGAPADASVAEGFSKYNTGTFDSVEVDMMSFYLNKTDYQEGKAKDDYVKFNGVPWGDSHSHDSYYAYRWFENHDMTYNYWGQADIWGHMSNSGLMRIASDVTGYARTGSCGQGWATNDCRKAMTAWVYRDTINHKAVFLIR